MTIPIENIYYLLCYSWNKLEEAEQIELQSKDFTELIDLFALVLKNGINHLLKKGFDKNYILHSEDTKRLRGKIDFGITIKKNLIKKARLHCHFDELSFDVLHNQIIKSTIRNLFLNDNLDNDIKTELREVYLNLKDVNLIKLEKKYFRLVQLHGNNYFYDFLLKVCELIFDNSFIDEKSGKYKFKDFIRDERQMAYLFEDFVRNFYKIELPKHFPNANTYRENIDWAAKAVEESSIEYLPKMQTDVSIEFENKKIIIDTKYYVDTFQSYYDKQTIRNAHLNQLFAYLKNIEVKGGNNINCDGILLYPQTDKKIVEKFVIWAHNVYIRTINLNQNWKDIHDELLKIVMK
jgi:5-methylcytosine-specific restriction enzyme subunit McrC